MTERSKIERYNPRPIDAMFWADLGYTLVREIRCECGFINPVQDEWHTGYFKAECGGCFEELDIQTILKTPFRTPNLIKMIEGDTDQIKRKHSKTQSTTKTESPDVAIVEECLPPTIKDELKKYVEILERQEREKERKRHDGYEKWIKDGDSYGQKE